MDRVWSGYRCWERVDINFDDPVAFIVWLGIFEPGEKLEIIVRKPQKKASNAQNRYYWPVVIHAISEFTGHTPEEVHDILKWKFLKRKDDKGLEYVPSTMEITTREREQYHEDCRRWASVVLGLSIPLPNEVEDATQES